MMTVITENTVEAGNETAWDENWRERSEFARRQPGFISVQMCVPVNDMSKRIIIGTWETRADWEHFHNSPEFREIRSRLKGLNEPGRDPEWYEVIEMQVGTKAEG